MGIYEIEGPALFRSRKIRLFSIINLFREMKSKRARMGWSTSRTELVPETKVEPHSCMSRALLGALYTSYICIVMRSSWVFTFENYKTPHIMPMLSSIIQLQIHTFLSLFLFSVQRKFFVRILVVWSVSTRRKSFHLEVWYWDVIIKFYDHYALCVKQIPIE